MRDFVPVRRVSGRGGSGVCVLSCPERSESYLARSFYGRGGRPHRGRRVRVLRLKMREWIASTPALLMCFRPCVILERSEESRILLPLPSRARATRVRVAGGGQLCGSVSAPGSAAHHPAPCAHCRDPLLAHQDANQRVGISCPCQVPDSSKLGLRGEPAVFQSASKTDLRHRSKSAFVESYKTTSGKLATLCSTK